MPRPRIESVNVKHRIKIVPLIDSPLLATVPAKPVQRTLEVQPFRGRHWEKALRLDSSVRPGDGHEGADGQKNFAGLSGKEKINIAFIRGAGLFDEPHRRIMCIPVHMVRRCFIRRRTTDYEL